MYNMIFGFNPLAATLLHLLEANAREIDRFRDCFLNEEGTEVIIYTRTGGNNRRDYEDSNAKLRKLKGFIVDEDDGFDDTYALFRYSIPEKYRTSLGIIAKRGFGVDPAKRWKETLLELADFGKAKTKER